VQALYARSGLRSSWDLVIAGVIDQLETSQSTWGRSDVIEALTVVIPNRPGLTAEQVRAVIENGAERVLAHDDVIPLIAGDRHGGARYSTWWTLQTEQAVLQIIQSGHDTDLPLPDRATVEEAVAGLGDDQAEAVSRIISGRERVAVLVGPAGSGKTRTLAAARHAWESGGISVVGVAPSAVAAGVLTEQAGIVSDTLAKYLHDLQNGHIGIEPGSVIVCDEASMVSTRDLAALVSFVDYNAASWCWSETTTSSGQSRPAACSASSPPTPSPPN
jgi:hypothetical protein